jgi:hypothetical protein
MTSSGESQGIDVPLDGASDPRRRRKLLAWATIGLLGAVAIFILMPGHDPRLVGQWSDAGEAGPRGKRSATFELHAGGDGLVKFSDLSVTLPLRWSTSSGRLLLYMNCESRLQEMHAQLLELWESVRGVPVQARIGRFDIQDVTSDRIQFDGQAWEREPGP